jgi:sigma-B regulation protein RsbU (phosphoserine phosphatase)
MGMSLKTLLGLSLSLLVVNFITYYAALPGWVFILTSLLFINGCLLAWYHNAKEEEAAESSFPEDLINNELDMAKRVQEGLLSVESPHIEGVSIAKRCIPASNVGGDFYTIIWKNSEKLTQKAKTPGVIEYVSGSSFQIGIAIGDVAGHGVSSALVMALSAGIMDKIAHNHESPAEVLQRSNNDIEKFISNSTISHLTALYATINIEQKTLTVAKAGHHPILRITADNTVDHLDSEGTFLGMFKDETYEDKDYTLNSKDRLVFYTDGIIETTNTKKEEYGLERMQNLMVKHSDKDIESLMDIIYDDVKAFRGTGPVKDDQTLVILEID